MDLTSPFPLRPSSTARQRRRRRTTTQGRSALAQGLQSTSSMTRPPLLSIQVPRSTRRRSRERHAERDDTDTMTTYSEAGVKAKAGSDVALTPDVSISYRRSLTSATIDGDSSQSLTATGDVTLTATQDTKTTTTANADAAGGNVVDRPRARARDRRRRGHGDDHCATSRGRSGQPLGERLVGQRVRGDRRREGRAERDRQQDRQLDRRRRRRRQQEVRRPADEREHLSAAPPARAPRRARRRAPRPATSGSSSSTKVEVAAAVAINIITTKSLALYVGGITINAGGVVSAKTLAATIADASAKGETVGTGTDDGIGVGVSINVADITNEAAVAQASTSVDGGSQSLVGGTLKVASTDGFASSGTLKIDGIATVQLHQDRRDPLRRVRHAPARPATTPLSRRRRKCRRSAERASTSRR